MTPARTWASSLLLVAGLFVAGGCGWHERPASFMDGDEHRMPLDYWTAQDVVFCDTHRTHGGTFVGYWSTKHFSIASARASVCPIAPPKTDAGNVWILSEHATSDDNETFALFSSIQASSPMGTWTVLPELTWACGIGPEVTDAGQVGVSLRWVLEPHDRVGQWDGSYQYTLGDTVYSALAVTWFASDIETEALWLDGSDSAYLTAQIRNIPPAKSPDVLPLITLTVEGSPVTFNLAEWEAVLLPMLRDCESSQPPKTEPA